jgi:hypothetical protein
MNQAPVSNEALFETVKYSGPLGFRYKKTLLCMILYLHGDTSLDYDHLGCCAVYSDGCIFLRNAGLQPQVC